MGTSKRRKSTTKREPKNKKIKYHEVDDDEEEEEEEYEVEKILDRMYGEDGVLYYKVKWIGFPEDQCTWEPLGHLQCVDKIREFDNTRKGEYIVEAIRSKRKKEGRTEYKVKWIGYPESQNTWEPETNILDKNLIEDFERKEGVRYSAKKQVASESPHSSSSSSSSSRGLIILLLFFFF